MKLTSFLSVALATVAAGQQIKIMLLGDSITEITCWRPLVWQQFVSAGVASSVDLVGSMNDLQGSCSRPSGFDPNHEGHSGWQAYDIAKNNIAGWVQSTKPDIVQFMLGTNDVNIGKRDVNTILGAYTSIVNAIRSANPKAKIIIDKLIPTSWSDATIEAVNSAIPGWVSQQSTSTSPIVIADCSRANGFTNNMLQGDGVHPNANGDQFIAQQVGPKLIQFIKDVQGGGSQPQTTTSTTLQTTTTRPPPSSTTYGIDPVCQKKYWQCGGTTYTGETCCESGTKCNVVNEWYSQCV